MKRTNVWTMLLVLVLMLSLTTGTFARSLADGSKSLEDASVPLVKLGSTVTDEFMNTAEVSQNFSDNWDGKDLDDLSDGSTYVRLTLIKDGYIDQSVISGASPTFNGSNISSVDAATLGGSAKSAFVLHTEFSTEFDTDFGAKDLDDLADGSTYVRLTAVKDGYIDQDVSNGANPTFGTPTVSTPSSGGHAANKDYVDDLVNGLSWMKPAISIQNNPGIETEGFRYIVGDTPTGDWVGHAADIAEYISSAWSFTDATDGDAIYLTSDEVQYNYNGSDWVTFGSTTVHNNTTGKQGGTTGEYYHLTSAQETALTSAGNADAYHIHSLNNMTDDVNTSQIEADAVNDLKIDWGAGANQVDLDDVPDSATYAKLTVTKDGYIDQDVGNGSSPTLDGTNFTGIPSSGITAFNSDVESTIDSYSYNSTEVYTKTEADAEFVAQDDFATDWGTQWDLKDLDDLPNGTTYGRATLTQLGYINQSVVSGASPTFDGSNITGITADDADTLDGQEGSWYQSRANHTGTQLSSTISDFATAWGTQWDLKDLDDLSDGSTYVRLTAVKDGYIDQDVGSGSSPTLDGTNFTGIPSSGITDFDADVEAVIDAYSYNSTEVYTKTEIDSTIGNYYTKTQTDATIEAYAYSKTVTYTQTEVDNIVDGLLLVNEVDRTVEVFTTTGANHVCNLTEEPLWMTLVYYGSTVVQTPTTDFTLDKSGKTVTMIGGEAGATIKIAYEYEK